MPVICHVHTNSHLVGGIENPDLSPGLRASPGQNLRAQAGLCVNSTHQSDIIWATTGGALSRHLSFRRVTVRSSLGGRFSPTTLEACEAPIRILAGGLALSLGLNGWGTAANKGCIRNVANSLTDPGDGLRVSNGGSIHSPGSPLHLDIYGCARDGIHLDCDAVGSFGPVGRDAGLVTTGAFNGRFGMNVRNSSHAFVGGDAASARVEGAPAATPLNGGSVSTTGEPVGGQVALDDVLVRNPGGDPSGWNAVLAEPRSNTRLSLVCRYT